MRNFLKVLALCVLVLVATGAIVALAVHWAGALDGAVFTIDGRRFEGPVVALAAGAAAAFALMLAFGIVVSVLACVAIIVPLVLALAALGSLFALVFGLMPLLVPALLLAGACVLLARWIRRPRSAPLAGKHLPDRERTPDTA